MKSEQQLPLKEPLLVLFALGRTVNAASGDGAEWKPIIGKGDHRKAYKQWATHAGDASLLIALVWAEPVGPDGGCRAYTNACLPPGALAAAVWHYTGIS